MIQNNTPVLVNPNNQPVTSAGLAAPNGRYLEVRLNSVADAKSAVQNHIDILNTVKKFNFDGIEFLIARELESQIQAVIGGIFNARVFYARIAPRDQNVHYSLPELVTTAASKGHTSVGKPEAEQPAGAELEGIAAGNEFDDAPSAANATTAKPAQGKRAKA